MLVAMNDQRDDGQRHQGERPGDPAAWCTTMKRRAVTILSKMAMHARGEHLVQRVHIGGDAGDEAADGIFVEENDILRLDVAEDLAAQIEHDLLAGPLHQVGLDELEEERHAKRGEIKARNLCDAGKGQCGERWRARARTACDRRA